MPENPNYWHTISWWRQCLIERLCDIFVLNFGATKKVKHEQILIMGSILKFSISPNDKVVYIFWIKRITHLQQVMTGIIRIWQASSFCSMVVVAVIVIIILYCYRFSAAIFLLLSTHIHSYDECLYLVSVCVFMRMQQIKKTKSCLTNSKCDRTGFSHNDISWVCVCALFFSYDHFLLEISKYLYVLKWKQRNKFSSSFFSPQLQITISGVYQ